MASKPTDLPEWATTAGDDVKLEPLSGRKASGFESAKLLPAQYINWLLNVIYQWLDYLNDGDLSGNHTIDGTLDTTGKLTVDAGGADITGDSDITGTLDATGQITATTFAHTAVEKKLICAGAGRSTVGTFSFNPGIWTSSAGSDAFYIHPEFKVGDKIEAISVSQNPNTTTPGQISISVTNSDGTSTAPQTSSFGSGSAGAWRNDTFTLGTPITLTAGDAVIIYYTAASNPDIVQDIEIEYSHPA